MADGGGRALHKLTDARVKRAAEGRHADGGGLYLTVRSGGARGWAFMWKRQGKRREMGLGAYPTVSLARARALAAVHRVTVAEGGDPIAEKRREEEPTFGRCTELFLDAHEERWSNAKHRAQWRSSLATYAAPLNGRPVSEIGTNDVLRVLNPIWKEKAETANRVRGRIERVLDYAKARGWREGENPARWRGGLQPILPAPPKLTRGHHAAMGWREVPTFVAALRARPAMAARALEFLILTAARSGEVLGARWDEIEWEGEDGAVWTVPAERMKARRPHRVPLSPAAVEVLRPLAETRRGALVFPGQSIDAATGEPKALSIMALTMCMRRMQRGDVTPHGFRSAFRDWAGDETGHAREVAEAALAHAVGDATERAYRRGDALAKRRALMEAWADWCGRGGEAGAKVVRLRAG